jgi:lipoyl-dependent peroxiredoxin
VETLFIKIEIFSRRNGKTPFCRLVPPFFSYFYPHSRLPYPLDLWKTLRTEKRTPRSTGVKILYQAKAKAKGGRDGHVESDDGVLRLDLSIPKSLGGPGKPGATNPEQLFAAGYSACFESAIRHVARAKKVAIPELTVEATVGLTPIDSGFALVVALESVFTGLSEDVARGLVETAHKVCPYSNALRNNVDVALSVKVD